MVQTGWARERETLGRAAGLTVPVISEGPACGKEGVHSSSCMCRAELPVRYLCTDAM